MNYRSKIIVVVPLIVTLVFMLLFGLIVTQQLFGPPDSKAVFCETCNTGLIREPANTWSNFGFIAAGLCMTALLASGKFNHNKNSFTQKQFYALFFPSLVVFLGPGSMMMHATQTQIGGFFDMLSMYLVASFISSYAMQRYFGLSNGRFVLAFVMELAICIWANFQPYHIIFNFFGNATFGFFICTGVLFEILNVYSGKKIQVESKWAWFALASLLISLGVWNLSKTGSALCNPNSLLQGHAVWHLGDALAAFLLFRYYVSENVPLRNEITNGAS